MNIIPKLSSNTVNSSVAPATAEVVMSMPSLLICKIFISDMNTVTFSVYKKWNHYTLRAFRYVEPSQVKCLHPDCAPHFTLSIQQFIV